MKIKLKKKHFSDKIDLTIFFIENIEFITMDNDADSICSSSTLESTEVDEAKASRNRDYPYTFTDLLDAGTMRPRYNNIHKAEGYDLVFTEFDENPEYVQKKLKVLYKKNQYHKFDDSEVIELYDETVVMMKKVPIKVEYHNLVDVFDILKTTKTEDNKKAFVFQPVVKIRGDFDNEMIVLNSNDCRLIMAIAKKNFGPGDRLERTPSQQEHYFHFGQKVVDITTSTHAVVVGETMEYAYLLSHESLCTDVNNHTPLLPIKRPIQYLDKVHARKALNYVAVEECAKMADYVEDTWLRFQYVNRTYRLGEPTLEDMGMAV